MARINDAIKMVKNLVEAWKFTRILPESTETWRGKFYQLAFVLELLPVYHHSTMLHHIPRFLWPLLLLTPVVALTMACSVVSPNATPATATPPPPPKPAIVERAARDLELGGIEVTCTVRNDGSGGNIEVAVTVDSEDGYWKKSETVWIDKDRESTVAKDFQEVSSGLANRRLQYACSAKEIPD
jgi:hypothetical protein